MCPKTTQRHGDIIPPPNEYFLHQRSISSTKGAFPPVSGSSDICTRWKPAKYFALCPCPDISCCTSAAVRKAMWKPDIPIFKKVVIEVQHIIKSWWCYSPYCDRGWWYEIRYQPCECRRRGITWKSSYWNFNENATNPRDRYMRCKRTFETRCWHRRKLNERESLGEQLIFSYLDISQEVTPAVHLLSGFL